MQEFEIIRFILRLRRGLAPRPSFSFISSVLLKRSFVMAGEKHVPPVALRRYLRALPEDLVSSILQKHGLD